MKVGRIENSRVVDVLDGLTVAQAEALFHPDQIAAWNAAGSGFGLLPADTDNGYTDNGDGSYSAPADRPVEQIFHVISKADFMDHCFVQLEKLGTIANAAAAVARFGEIMAGARASADNGVTASIERYDSVDTFRKSETQQFFAFLQAAGLITSDESDIVLNNWPEA